MNTYERGCNGEDFAVERMQENGYIILERNWHSGHSEIDIITQKLDIIAFVEVKLRCIEAYTAPAEALRKGQRRRIVLAAVAYLKENHLYNNEQIQPRFDIFEINARLSDEFEVLDYYHIENAYDVGGLGVFI